MTNIPYEEKIKNRSNDWYYNKCIRQYHFIIKSEGANQRYKEEIKRLTKAKETTENEYGGLLKTFAKSETEYKEKIAQLNKIIDELEKEIKITIKKMSLKSSESSLIMKSSLEIILDRLKELKEEGKDNENR